MRLPVPTSVHGFLVDHTCQQTAGKCEQTLSLSLPSRVRTEIIASAAERGFTIVHTAKQGYVVYCSVVH